MEKVATTLGLLFVIIQLVRFLVEGIVEARAARRAGIRKPVFAETAIAGLATFAVTYLLVQIMVMK